MNSCSGAGSEPTRLVGKVGAPKRYNPSSRTRGRHARYTDEVSEHLLRRKVRGIF